MKKWYFSILFLIFIFLLAFGAVAFSDADQTVSVLEKRALKTMPGLSLESLFGGDYTKELEEYYSDTFPLRDIFMSVNRTLNSFYYFSAGGNDNMLLISHDSDEIASGGESLDDVKNALGNNTDAAAPSEPLQTSVPAFALASPSPSSGQLPELENPGEEKAVQAGNSIIIIGNRAMEIPSNNRKAITLYANAVSSIQKKLPGCRVFSLIAPNSGEFYSPESFHTGRHSQKDMIENAYRQMSGVLTVDSYSKIRSKIDEYVYFRTDHHWTALGAYYAYAAFCETAGLETIPLENFKSGRYDRFLGTMYGWTSKYSQSQALKNDPDYVDYYLPIIDSKAQYFRSPGLQNGIDIPVVDTAISESYSNKYLCFVRGDTPICRIVTSNKNGKKIVVIKESFANALIPFLTSHYEEIYVVDPREFNSEEHPVKFNLISFVTEHKIGDVLVLNYIFAVNNTAYTSKIESLLGN